VDDLAGDEVVHLFAGGGGPVDVCHGVECSMRESSRRIHERCCTGWGQGEPTLSAD
jgi:hypothetical protein